jgi:hypothetical protein
MDGTRRIAAKLAVAGVLEVEQRKERLDPAEWQRNGLRGIVRLRLAKVDQVPDVHAEATK